MAHIGFISRAARQLQEQPGLRERPVNLIQAMLAARDREGSGITEADVAGNVLTMLLAGEDTTANTLAWLIWLLHRNPQALQRANEEAPWSAAPPARAASTSSPGWTSSKPAPTR